MKELIEFLKMAEKQNSLVTIDREYVPTIIEALEKQTVMTNREALNYFEKRLRLGQCGKNTTQRKAFQKAIEALKTQDNTLRLIGAIKKRYSNLNRISFRGSQVVYILERLSIESEVNRNEDC